MSKSETKELKNFMNNIHSGFASILDTELYYELSGSGPDIVFLHGNPVDLHLWDYQIEEFSKNYRVLRYDMRGFGRSGNPTPAGYSHAEDLKALMEYLGIKEAIIVGLSMGGGAAINFSILYPEMTRAMVAADPSLGGYIFSDEFVSGIQAIPQIVKEKGIDAARSSVLEIEIFKYAFKSEEVKQKLTEMVYSYPGWHWLNRDTGIPINPPAIERLGEIKAPSLVIIGEHDIPDFHNIANIMEERIPNVRKVFMRGIGHVVNMEAPKEFNKIVLEFLNNRLQ